MTVSADFNDVVPQADQTAIILGANLATPVSLQLAWGAGVPQGNGPNVRVGTIDPLVVPAGTKAEAAQFPLVGQTTSSTAMTAGYVGLSDTLSKELDYDAMIDVLRVMSANVMGHIVNRVDADGLSQLESATSNTDVSAVGDGSLSDTVVLTSIAQYLLQFPNRSGGGWGLVLHPAQLNDVNLSLAASGGNQISGPAESERVVNQMSIREGYLGKRHGVDWYVAANVPVTGGNATGGLLTTGELGALTYRVWETVNIESDYTPRSKTWELTWAIRYAWMISKQSNIRGIVSRGTFS